MRIAAFFPSAREGGGVWRKERRIDLQSVKVAISYILFKDRFAR